MAALGFASAALGLQVRFLHAFPFFEHIADHSLVFQGIVAKVRLRALCFRCRCVLELTSFPLM